MAITEYKISAESGHPWILPNGATTASKFTIKDLYSDCTGADGVDSGVIKMTPNGTDASIDPTGLNALSHREDIHAAFKAFKEAVSHLEANDHVCPNATRIACSYLAQQLPLPLDETALYALNLYTPKSLSFLTGSHSFIDLQPGMRLKVVYGNLYSETIGDDVVTSYAGTGTDYMNISSVQDSNLLSFNAALNTEGISVPLATGKNNRVAATAMDLMSNLPYQRLVYPNQPFTAVNVPNDDPGVNATIVRAQTYQDLENQMQYYPSVAPAQDEYAIFFGRTIVIPEISIHVNGTKTFVPVGTTLRHLVERHYVAPTLPTSLKYLRFASGTPVSVRFTSPTIGYDMMVLPGDNISW